MAATQQKAPRAADVAQLSCEGSTTSHSRGRTEPNGNGKKKEGTKKQQQQQQPVSRGVKFPYGASWRWVRTGAPRRSEEEEAAARCRSTVRRERDEHPGMKGPAHSTWSRRDEDDGSVGPPPQRTLLLLLPPLPRMEDEDEDDGDDAA
ncbi:hypothetical protein F2P81_015514 [Scophthalmus maximus]|uniref:Uncharacterized protein n=1 Tax=Scophthalmus maximus TaxID=52904 RepID=A0A6A4SQC4_SCOMX|nr:hypothetical protein F2P81_015514 [Scophthalmus maximus]